MERKLAVSMFGQKRLSREGGIEIVAKELCTRMVQNGCTVTCYNRSGHHVSGAEYDNKTEYEAKGFDMAIDALKILKERKVPVHWWIVGDGELRECLEKQVRNNGVEQYLTEYVQNELKGIPNV